MTALANTIAYIPRRQRAAPPAGLTDRANLVDLLGSYFGETSKSATWVDQNAAMKVSTVYGCIMLNARTRGMLPLHIIRTTRDGGRERIEPPNARVLWGRPNPEVAAPVFWTTVFIHQETHGEAFLFVEYNEARVPVAMWPVEPKRVRLGRDPKTREKVYEIDGHLPQKDASAGGNMIHLLGPSSDGLRGISPIRAAAQSIGLALGAETYAARMYSNGTAVSGYLSTDQDLTAEQAADLSNAWSTLHGGPENAYRPAVLPRGTKWETLQFNAEDAQLLMSRQFQVSDLARFWGVPEHLVGAHDKASSWGAGIDLLTRGYLMFALQSRLTMDEATISDVLLPRGQVIKWEVAGLLRSDLLQQAQRLAIERQNGVITPNEWRDLLDRPRREDPEGDGFVTPLNMASSVAQAPAEEPRAVPEPDRTGELLGAMRSGFEGMAVALGRLMPTVTVNEREPYIPPLAPIAPRRRVVKNVERDASGEIVRVVESEEDLE